MEEFADNRSVLESLCALIERVHAEDSTFELKEISVSGTSSPDGNIQANERLALRRMDSLRRYVSERFGIDSLQIKTGVTEVMWPQLRAALRDSAVPEAAAVTEICSQGSDMSESDSRQRLCALKQMNGGRTWAWLAADVLPGLRSGSVVTVVFKRLPQALNETEVADTLVEELYETESESKPIECDGAWSLGTNAVEWGMLISNIYGEWDFSCRWSANLSVHYSALNYFSSRRKFRTFIFRPEVRYWFKEGHERFYVDAHVQMAAYNYASSARHLRIQDRGGKHPALGGGLGIGYRLPLGRDSRWALEWSLGVGFYHLKYDRFENRHNGRLVDTKTRNWFGIDNASFSVVFNLTGEKR